MKNKEKGLSPVFLCACRRAWALPLCLSLGVYPLCTLEALDEFSSQESISPAWPAYITSRSRLHIFIYIYIVIFFSSCFQPFFSFLGTSPSSPTVIMYITYNLILWIESWLTPPPHSLLVWTLVILFLLLTSLTLTRTKIRSFSERNPPKLTSSFEICIRNFQPLLLPVVPFEVRLPGGRRQVLI